jgi:hypothetical protein
MFLKLYFVKEYNVCIQYYTSRRDNFVFCVLQDTGEKETGEVDKFFMLKKKKRNNFS